MYFILSIFTIISAGISLGYSLQSIIITKETNAFYALSRSLSVFVLTLFTLFIHHCGYLIAMALIMTIIQLLDGIIGMMIQDKFKTFGPLITAFINLVLLVLFLI